MKKPTTLTALLEELKAEAIRTDIVPLKTTKAVIFLSDEAADEEDGVKLSGEECKLLFANKDIVDRMLEALGYPSEASLCLYDLTLSGEMMDYIERKFVAVDEG